MSSSSVENGQGRTPGRRPRSHALSITLLLALSSVLLLSPAVDARRLRRPVRTLQDEEGPAPAPASEGTSLPPITPFPTVVPVPEPAPAPSATSGEKAPTTPFPTPDFPDDGLGLDDFVLVEVEDDEEEEEEEEEEEDEEEEPMEEEEEDEEEEEEEEDEEGPGTIVDVASSSSDFSLLVQVVAAAGLADVLASDGPYTVFAPTDDAFLALGSDTIDDLLADAEGLADVLRYHVVGGRVMAADVETGAVPTLNGADIDIVVGEDGSVAVNDANVVATDVEASNGVIHAIDAVLLPPDMEVVTSEDVELEGGEEEEEDPEEEEPEEEEEEPEEEEPVEEDDAPDDDGGYGDAAAGSGSSSAPYMSKATKTSKSSKTKTAKSSTKSGKSSSSKAGKSVATSDDGHGSDYAGKAAKAATGKAGKAVAPSAEPIRRRRR